MRDKNKGKISYCEQIKFSEPILNHEQQKSSISLPNNVLRFPADDLTSCYPKKIILKSNGKHVSADGVVRAKNKCKRS